MKFECIIPKEYIYYDTEATQDEIKRVKTELLKKDHKKRDLLDIHKHMPIYCPANGVLCIEPTRKIKSFLRLINGDLLYERHFIHLFDTGYYRHGYVKYTSINYKDVYLNTTLLQTIFELNQEYGLYPNIVDSVENFVNSPLTLSINIPKKCDIIRERNHV